MILLSHVVCSVTFKCKWTSSSCEDDVSGGVWCSVNRPCFSVYCMCQSLMNWQQIRHLNLYFNVVKIGAGHPYCSYSFQFYRWIVVGGGIGFTSRGQGGVCEPGLGKTFSYLLMSLQTVSSVTMGLLMSIETSVPSSLGTLSNRNVLLDMVLSAPHKDFYSHTVSCRCNCSGLSFKHLEHKLSNFLAIFLLIGFHYDSIC